MSATHTACPVHAGQWFNKSTGACSCGSQHSINGLPTSAPVNTESAPKDGCTNSIAERAEFPVGTTVRFTQADIERVITVGELGVVVESFAPNTGRNVRLGDGRVVNVPTWYLEDETFFADDERKAGLPITIDGRSDAVVLLADLVSTGGRDEIDSFTGHVLALLPGSYTPYVTWYVQGVGSTVVSATHGNYFDDDQAALADFDQRRAFRNEGYLLRVLRETVAAVHR